MVPNDEISLADGHCNNSAECTLLAQNGSAISNLEENDAHECEMLMSMNNGPSDELNVSNVAVANENKGSQGLYDLRILRLSRIRNPVKTHKSKHFFLN